MAFSAPSTGIVTHLRLLLYTVSFRFHVHWQLMIFTYHTHIHIPYILYLCGLEDQAERKNSQSKMVIDQQRQMV